MSGRDTNKYPPAAVQQRATKTAFLIDCDGGLGSAFHPKRKTNIKPELIKAFPSNSDVFLFFNSNDNHIVQRLKELELNYPNVHGFPNIIKNSRNGADMNLSFMLGVINSKYTNYVIIARQDRAYGEIKERLEYTHPHLKNHVDLHRFEKPKELAEYVRKLNEGQFKSTELHLNHGYLAIATSLTLSALPTTVTYTPDNLFRHCPLESWQQSSCLYRFKELLLHLTEEHPEVHYQYCSTCEEMIRKDDWSQYQLYEEHLRKDHIENNAGFRLSMWCE